MTKKTVKGAIAQNPKCDRLSFTQPLHVGSSIAHCCIEKDYSQGNS
ncbi:hypothetical protein PN498_07305 [Oscillatoria sp. CS-180]|nr:hypothetical protein [Oscillatoria sp. CS-180]MDB9525788.1 hypothetical protein [Oscillatoria sp. CS-180]